MNKVYQLNICTGFLIFLFIVGNCSATPQKTDISFNGQVTWLDIEGGFYGIITPDGSKYLPVNLPDGYKVDGVTVDVTGIIPDDVMTIQMWGKPIRIQSINPVNKDNPFIQPWYAPDDNMSNYGNENISENLVMAASGLQNGLNLIDGQLLSIAQNMSINGTVEKNIKNQLLHGLEMPAVMQLSYMDKTGKVTKIVPEKYDSFEGEDVSGQDFASSLISYPVPGMSGYFTMKEGIDAVILAYPVFSVDKKVSGYVEALFDPASLAEKYALPFLDGTKYDLMVAQPDGKILYDGHPDMNGQETWNNSIFDEFPDLLNFTAHYQNAEAGIDQYTYYRGNSKEIVKKDAIWTTVALHGTPWRVFILSR